MEMFITICVIFKVIKFDLASEPSHTVHTESAGKEADFEHTDDE